MFLWAVSGISGSEGAAVKDSGARRGLQSPGLGGGIWVRATVPSAAFSLDIGISGKWDSVQDQGNGVVAPPAPAQPQPDDLAARS